MKVLDYRDVKPQTWATKANPVIPPRNEVRTVISANDGAPFTMRINAILAKDASHEPHSHPWAHEVFVFSGQGTGFTADGEEISLKPGNVVYVPANEPHGWANTGDEPLRFVCCIPNVE